MLIPVHFLECLKIFEGFSWVPLLLNVATLSYIFYKAPFLVCVCVCVCHSNSPFKIDTLQKIAQQTYIYVCVRCQWKA